MISEPFGYGRHHSAALVHIPSGRHVDHGPQFGVGYVVWRCGTGSMNPVLTQEPPPFMRRCAKCHLDLAVPAGVYFAEKDGLVKIGCSRHPARRAADLGARLLAAHAGDYETERTLHRVFADVRVHGEWFAACDGLLSYIDRVLAEQAEAAA